MPIPCFTAPTFTLHALQQALQNVGACLVKDFPLHNRTYLEQQVRLWGDPLCESRNIDGGMVFTVSVDTVSELPAYANTPHAFDCHSDCAEMLQPPDTVLLLCEQSAPQGGNSLWVALDQILPVLSAATLLELQKPRFYFKHGQYPILTLNVQGEAEVRYQPLMFHLAEQVGVWQRNAEQAKALAEFEAAIQDKIQTFQLEAGDCFIFQNRRSLHGRSAFQGERRLQRVRFNIKA